MVCHGPSHSLVQPQRKVRIREDIIVLASQHLYEIAQQFYDHFLGGH